jgi:glyoxylase-like metal-dependent hydrolase (beta-lactamase superfamily II)
MKTANTAASAIGDIPAGSAPAVTGFFHEPTNSITYVVADEAGKRAVIIDPVLDYNPRRARTATIFVDGIVADIRKRGLAVEWILETHVHADHLSAAPYLRRVLGAKIAIGEHVAKVQGHFAKFYNFESGFHADGSQFDRLLRDGDSLPIGGFTAKVMHTPGHTPACVSYLVGDAVFCGDTLFMPDYGTARCDFPGGDARAMYASIRRLFALPPQTRVFVGHDYGVEGRGFAWQASVAQQRAANKHAREGVSEADFVRLRQARDATLELPELMLVAVQLNVRAGNPPPAENNGVAYAKLPLDRL